MHTLLSTGSFNILQQQKMAQEKDSAMPLRIYGPGNRNGPTERKHGLMHR
jgi:hypothetical protein